MTGIDAIYGGEGGRLLLAVGNSSFVGCADLDGAVLRRLDYVFSRTKTAPSPMDCAPAESAAMVSSYEQGVADALVMAVSQANIVVSPEILVCADLLRGVGEQAAASATDDGEVLS